MDSEPVKARVTQLLGRTGSRGGITQVKVTLISGKEADKRHLIRNVKGPVRIGDVLELMESEREARRLRWLSRIYLTVFQSQQIVYLRLQIIFLFERAICWILSLIVKMVLSPRQLIKISILLLIIIALSYSTWNHINAVFLFSPSIIWNFSKWFGLYDVFLWSIKLFFLVPFRYTLFLI